MNRIVVGFDGSPSATGALVWALAEARLRRAQITAWTVLDAAAGSADEPETLGSLARALRRVAEDYPVDHRIGRGGVAAGLLDACDDDDVLVIGSRRLNPLAAMLHGSVSRACLRAAGCPVVVVRPRPGPVAVRRARVIVGVSATAHASSALRVAAEEARIRGAALKVIHVVHWAHVRRADLIARATLQLAEWEKHLVEAELASSGLTVWPVVVYGDPARVLVRCSSGADLLVVGPPDRSRLAGRLACSTSDYCARHARCPVMVTGSADRAPRSVARDARRIPPPDNHRPPSPHSGRPLLDPRPAHRGEAQQGPPRLG